LKTIFFAAALTLTPFSAFSQTGDQSFAILDAGRSYVVLGSRESRTGGLLGLQLVRDDPKFKWRGPVVKPVETIYAMYHHGSDQFYGDTQTFAFGATYGLRLVLASQSRLYLQYDFGCQLDTERSYGLPSEWDVTPWLTLGSLVSGKHPFEFGLSAMHVSNIYTQRPNFGQDFLFAFVGFKL
jgi:hypothetical protein